MGTRQVATVRFTIPANATIGLTPITFGDAPTVQSVSGLTGLFQAAFQNGTVQIGSTAAGVQVSGRVLTPDGRGVRNAVVSITDSNAVTRNVTTSSFGVYRFEDVAGGETYVIGVAAKRYRFAPRVIQIVSSLADIDFEALE